MTMPFSDLALSRRLERAEGYACAQYSAARKRLLPESGAECMELDGIDVVFDGADSPATKTFGLNLFQELTEDTLSTIERFFLDRKAPVQHEVSPFAGVNTLDILCRRNYRPIEISNVLCQSLTALSPVPSHPSPDSAKVTARVISPHEASLWAEVSSRGWSHEYPQLRDFFESFAAMVTARKQSFSFLATLEDEPGAAGALSIFGGVALFSGSSTAPEFRRRGLQNALLRERMTFALEHGCDLAAIVTMPGSDSQRNAERNGFQVAYTRCKWKLCS